MSEAYVKSIKTAAKAIKSADRILITSHINPDGDTIGSLIALGLGLLSIDKRVVMVSPDGVPPRYQFLPGSELVLTDIRGKADIGIAVDCGSSNQLGKFAKKFQSIRETFQVDHHDFADSFCKYLVVDANAAAVGEIVFELLQEMNVEITPMIATNILTSIIVDTGSFRFSNIRGKTFRICADLLDSGVDLKHLMEEAYWKKTETTVRLESACIDRMKFERNGKVVWSLIRQPDFKKVNGTMADVDAVADDLRAIEGVKAAAVFREDERGNVRISLRSAAGINVAEVAKQFGGGGHYNSAGCLIPYSMSNVNKVIKILCTLVS